MMDFLGGVGIVVRQIPVILSDPDIWEVLRNISLILLCCFPFALIWQIAETLHRARRKQTPRRTRKRRKALIREERKWKRAQRRLAE